METLRVVAACCGMPIHPARGHRRLRHHRLSLPGHVYLVTASALDRRPSFIGPAAVAAARCFATRALWGDAEPIAWVLMPDHAHWLVQLGDHDPLSCVVNRIKSASARAVNATRGGSGPVWAPAYHERCLRNDAQLHTAVTYIRENPVRASLVAQAQDYPFLVAHPPP